MQLKKKNKNKIVTIDIFRKRQGNINRCKAKKEETFKLTGDMSKKQAGKIQRIVQDRKAFMHETLKAVYRPFQKALVPERHHIKF